MRIGHSMKQNEKTKQFSFHANWSSNSFGQAAGENNNKKASEKQYYPNSGKLHFCKKCNIQKWLSYRLHAPL
jgi:hypothetical protein